MVALLEVILMAATLEMTGGVLSTTMIKGGLAAEFPAASLTTMVTV